MILDFQVPGTPAPQGSKRAYVTGGRARLVESSDKVKPWRSLVTLAAAEAMQAQGWEQPTVPLQVTLSFYLPRPKKHYRTGSKAHLLRDDAPMWHAQAPDADKLSRAVLDALTDAGVWRDDGRVAMLTATKAWSATPGLSVVIEPC